MLKRLVLQALMGCLLGLAVSTPALGQLLPPPPIERLPDPYAIEEPAASPPLPVDPELSTPALDGPVVEDPSVGPEPGMFWSPSNWFGERPTWYNPISWFSPVFWDGSIEAGLNGSDGNNNVVSFRTGFDLSRETETTNWDIDFTYGRTEANGVETQNNALLNSDWDYQLKQPRWSWFNKLGLEYDEFKAFDTRIFGNTGFGYLLVDRELTELRGRFGAGTSREIGGVDDQWKPEAAFGADFSHQLTPRQKFSLVVDHYPNWDDFGDYRIIADGSLVVVLDEASNLSLKFGLIDRYDSTPDGAQRNAIDYSMVLLWKL
ncbi:MAG: DUF481 domain-containing protein [Planctomycetota bacterium]